MSERRYAVLIAGSQFPDEPKLQPLRCPENDVDGLHEVLSSKTYGDFTDALVLKNVPHYEALLKINQVLKRAEKEDFVLIYYSGHGKLDMAGRLHLATFNTTVEALEATSIPVESIRNYVDVSPCSKVALMLDCCFSGAVGAAFARGNLDDQLRLASGGRGTYLMTASTGIQVALEKEQDRYGVFTKHVIEGIRGGGADLDGDGCVTMDELYRYVHGHVLDEGFQEPMKWDLNVRGALVVARTGRSPREERRRALRDRLLELAQEGTLPNRILSKALAVLAQPASDTPEARRYNALLDRLLERGLKVGDFIEEWYEVGATPASEPADSADRIVAVSRSRPTETHGPRRDIRVEVIQGIRRAGDFLKRLDLPRVIRNRGALGLDRIEGTARGSQLLSTSMAVQLSLAWILPVLMGGHFGEAFAWTLVAAGTLSGIVFGELCRRRAAWPGVAGGWLANQGVVLLALIYIDAHMVPISYQNLRAAFFITAAFATGLDRWALLRVSEAGKRANRIS
ncbi:MAG TPA: caspase family protein [bacterium]|nr:caspase family protein [bacterium]